MMALTWTYFPPTCRMTSAYWLSAPTATIVPFAAAVSSAREDEQPAASRAAPARAASTVSLLQRVGIAGYSVVSCVSWPGRYGSDPLLVMIMILNLGCNAFGESCGGSALPVRRARSGAAHGNLGHPASHGRLTAGAGSNDRGPFYP